MKCCGIFSGNTYLGHVGFQLVPVVEDPGSVVCPLPCMMVIL